MSQQTWQRRIPEDRHPAWRSWWHSPWRAYRYLDNDDAVDSDRPLSAEQRTVLLAFLWPRGRLITRWTDLWPPVTPPRVERTADLFTTPSGGGM